MRKLILLLLSLLPIMGLYGEPEIELKEIPQNPEHNSQILMSWLWNICWCIFWGIFGR